MAGFLFRWFSLPRFPKYMPRVQCGALSATLRAWHHMDRVECGPKGEWGKWRLDARDTRETTCRGWSCDQKIVRGSCYSQRLGLEVGYLWTIFRTSSVYGWGYKRRNCKWIGHLLNTTNHLLITCGTKDPTTHGQQQRMHTDITWKLYYILEFNIKPFIECALLITKWGMRKLLLSFRPESIKENCSIISSISWKTSRKFFACYLSTNKHLSLMT